MGAAWARPVRFRHMASAKNLIIMMGGLRVGKRQVVQSVVMAAGPSRSAWKGSANACGAPSDPQELGEFKARALACLKACEEQDRRQHIKPIRAKRVASLHATYDWENQQGCAVDQVLAMWVDTSHGSLGRLSDDLLVDEAAYGDSTPSLLA